MDTGSRNFSFPPPFEPRSKSGRAKCRFSCGVWSKIVRLFPPATMQGRKRDNSLPESRGQRGENVCMYKRGVWFSKPQEGISHAL